MLGELGHSVGGVCRVLVCPGGGRGGLTRRLGAGLLVCTVGVLLLVLVGLGYSVCGVGAGL